MDQEHESKKEDFLLRAELSSREKKELYFQRKKFSSSRRREEVGEESNTQEIGDERSELTW